MLVLPSFNPFFFFFVINFPLSMAKYPFQENTLFKKVKIRSLKFLKVSLTVWYHGELLVILLSNRFQVFYNKNIRPHLWQNCRIIMPLPLQELQKNRLSIPCPVLRLDSQVSGSDKAWLFFGQILGWNCCVFSETYRRGPINIPHNKSSLPQSQNKCRMRLNYLQGFVVSVCVFPFNIEKD